MSIANFIPASTAVPSPSLPERWMTWMLGSSALSSSAILPVPSGELSSMIRMDASGACSRMARTSGPKVRRLVVSGERDEEPGRGGLHVSVFHLVSTAA